MKSLQEPISQAVTLLAIAAQGSSSATHQESRDRKRAVRRIVTACLIAPIMVSLPLEWS
jgi:L-asparaginase II